MNNKTQTANTAFQLKGSLFTLTVLHLFTDQIDAITAQLVGLIKNTPKFFQNMPIVIDLQKFPTTSHIDFMTIDQCLREHQLIPVGVRGGTPQQQQNAIECGLAVLPNTKSEVTEISKTPTPATTPIPSATPTAPEVFAKVITQPVRSGQQIYARQADLIILTSVSPGAELLADGNIHVYGALRGRALAGVTGNEQARIFCQHLEAELVAIAGHYWVSEDLQKNTTKQNAQIYLENEKLHIGTF